MTRGEGNAPAWNDGAVVFQHQGGTRRGCPPRTVHHRTTEVQVGFSIAFGLLKGRAEFVRLETRRRQLYPAPTEGNAHSTGKNIIHCRTNLARTRKLDAGHK